MRPIEFRGKRLDNGKWVYGYYQYDFYTDRHGIVTFTENEEKIYEVDPETVGQYTGLNDKNGKKIFEDDIVRFYGDNLVIKYHDIHAYFMLGPDRLAKGWAEMSKIIGNKHDNFELLE